MNVFFGGSLPGFKKNKDIYLSVRDEILKQGNSLTRDWVNEEIWGTKTKSSDMVNLTKKAIEKSETSIIEGSYDISAVGLQIKLSVEKGLPTLILMEDQVYNKNVLNDYFIEEKYHKFVKVEKYNQISLESVVSDFLFWARTNRKIVRFNLEIEKEQDDYLKTQADKNKTSKSEEIRNLIAKEMINNPHSR